MQGHLSVKCECGETYETKYDKPSGHSFSKVVADDGTVCSQSRSVMVAFDFEAQQSVPVPDAWRRALEAE